MDTKNIRFSDRIFKNENENLIFQELIEVISDQFNFKNIGYNYLDDYDHIPGEFYDWLFQQIIELYLEVDEINIIYSDFNRLKTVSKSLYEFLFVDILEFKDKINFDLDSKQLRSLVNNKLISIKEISNMSNNDVLGYNLIKWSIVSDSLNNNLDMLEENYWPIFKETFEI